jgi:hypothetical protein
MAFNDEKFRLFWRFPSDAGVFTDPEVLANYPVSNLKIDALSKKWKSAPDSGGGIQITVDLGSAQAISAFALLGHTISSGDSILLRYADNAAFTVGFGNIALTYHENTLIEYFTEVTKRYWRLIITVADSATTEIEAGRMVLGPHYQFERNVAPGWSGPGTSEDTSRNVRTRGGQRYSDEGSRLRTFQGSFTGLRDADFIELEALYDNYGTAKSFIISQLWEDYPVRRTLYGSLVRLGGTANTGGTANKWNFPIRMTEQK